MLETFSKFQPHVPSCLWSVAPIFYKDSFSELPAVQILHKDFFSGQRKEVTMLQKVLQRTAATFFMSCFKITQLSYNTVP